MNRNEIPINLRGFINYALKMDRLQRRLEEIEAAEVAAWVKGLPPPYENVKKKTRLKVVRREAA